MIGKFNIFCFVYLQYILAFCMKINQYWNQLKSKCLNAVLDEDFKFTEL